LKKKEKYRERRDGKDKKRRPRAAIPRTTTEREKEFES